MKTLFLIIPLAFLGVLILSAELLALKDDDWNFGKKYNPFIKRLACYALIVLSAVAIFGTGYESGCNKDLKGIIECSQDEYDFLDKDNPGITLPVEIITEDQAMTIWINGYMMGKQNMYGLLMPGSSYYLEVKISNSIQTKDSLNFLKIMNFIKE